MSIRIVLLILLVLLFHPDDPPLDNTYMCPILSCTVRESRLFDEKTHRGIDIETSMRTPVKASQGGVVALSGWSWDEDPDWRAIRVIIDHGYGIKTGYWHLSETSINVGDYVYRGQVIGRSGQTGWASWPHLHFLIMEDNVHRNPLDYISVEIIDD
jgi:murein DD-endopeptidase MepM/ murein hydrolase activator NlpD